MSRMQQIGWVILTAVCLTALFAGFLTPASYEVQFRDFPSARPSWAHPLGTDELGRDLLSRLLYGSRVSLLLAPAAALFTTLIAAMIGAIAGYFGGLWERLALATTDLSLALPLFFLLITVRALLPLNVSPVTSAVITFAVLAALGWAASARVLCAGARTLRNSDFLLQARASGCGGARLLFWHLLPNLKPVLFAQFLISIPLFILAEANLGMLGLGIAEPLPSWGNLLRGLQSYETVRNNPASLAPVVLMVLVISAIQLTLPNEDLPT